jgi:hypothetical protein
MKKLLLEVLAWLVLAGIIGGLTWFGLYMWAWEIEHCFGM